MKIVQGGVLGTWFWFCLVIPSHRCREDRVHLFDNYLLSRVTEPRNDLFRTVCLVHDFDFASSFPVIVVDKIACKRMCFAWVICVSDNMNLFSPHNKTFGASKNHFVPGGEAFQPAWVARLSDGSLDWQKQLQPTLQVPAPTHFWFLEVKCSKANT